MSVEQPPTKRSKKADAKANASGSTVSAAADVNDHKHLNASLTLLRTQDDLIALAGLPLDHDLVIDNFKLCAIIRGIVAASEAGSMFDETEVSMRICGRSPRAVRSCYRIIARLRGKIQMEDTKSRYPPLNSSTRRLSVVEFFNLPNPNCKGIKFC